MTLFDTTSKYKGGYPRSTLVQKSGRGDSETIEFKRYGDHKDSFSIFL